MKQNGGTFSSRLGMITALLPDAGTNSVTPAATGGSMANEDLMYFSASTIKWEGLQGIVYTARQII